MCSNYFEKLILQARHLDDGIEKLTEMWKVPQVLVGCFTEHTEETDSHLTALWNTIKKTQTGIEEVLSSTKEFKSPDSVSMKKLLQETKKQYELLKEQSDNLESVLAEYGYHYENDTVDEINVSNSNLSNQYSYKEMKNLEDEVSTNLSLNCEEKQKQLTPTANYSYISHSITTPAINSLASFSADTPMMYIDYVCTPLRERPEEPVYSKHFYNILKK